MKCWGIGFAASLVAAALFGAVLSGPAQAQDITGTNSGDRLCGTIYADLITLLDGPDYSYAGDGNDTVGGGDGRDAIFGGNNNDTIYGGPGADSGTYSENYCGPSDGTVHVDTRVLDGGWGEDDIFGNDGADRLRGGTGNDNLQGNAGNDTILAKDGMVDIVQGGSDFDTCIVDAIDTISGCEAFE